MKVHKLLRLHRLCEETTEGGDGSSAAATVVSEPQTETTPASVEPETEGEASDVDWGSLVTDDDDWDETPITPAEQAPVTPEAPEQPPVEPAAEPEQVQPEPEAPTPQLTLEELQAHEAAYVEQLAGLYKFSDEDALRLQVEPENVLPQLAARLHMDVLRSAVTQMQAMIPQMVQSTTRQSTREAKAREIFFKAWPELRGHDAHIMQVGQMFRSINGAAPPDVAVKMIGEMTMQALGLQRSASQSQPQPDVSRTFTPAAPGRVGATQTALTEWEELLADDD